ncbi:MAG: hypothetical protein RBT33_03700 [Candidatus Dojkabacteria bacterium]|jgi:hypothetical protein|nr:hypothetical protein [Candidatus Dojkabacteria bacterium]
MPDIFEPQDIGPGDDSRRESEIEKLKKARIAIAYYYRQISEDNPSDENGYTAFDQLILYEFDIANDEDVYDQIEELKEDIVFFAQMLDEGEGEIILEYQINEDETLLRIAKGVLEGYITDDTISRWADLTSMEQIILYEFGNMEIDRMIAIKKKLKSIELGLRGGSTISKKDDIDDDYKKIEKNDIDLNLY